MLTVSSKDHQPFKDSDKEAFVHQGISMRKFTRKFTLSDDVVVKGASLKNGMLTISMEKIIPEGKKKRLIDIVSE